MDILTLDFETYFSDDYTLKKTTTEGYIRDRRFEALMVGYRLPNGDSGWVSGDQIQAFLSSFDWSKTAILAHHAHFDGLILSHHFGVKPALWLDTLSMARLIHGNHLSAALGSLAHHYGLSEKSVPYDLFKGRHWDELSPRAQDELGTGCVQDVLLTWQIFQKMVPLVPAEELIVIDTTVRMFTEPTIEGDTRLFEKLRDDEFLRKNERLLELGVSTSDLQSADRFVALLEAEGVEIEYKLGAPSKVTGERKEIPAIAKSDDFMKGLLDDPNDRVSDLAQARLDVRSTINETRSGRLASMSERGAMAVYLGYCGAHTLRWVGGDKVNFQNLGRGGQLRKGLRAPAGYTFGILDLSQIECRLLNRVAGQQDVLDLFAAGIDLYAAAASAALGQVITARTHPFERFLFKLIVLGGGYGMGGKKYVITCRRATSTIKDQAMVDLILAMTEQDGINVVNGYRRGAPCVTQLWREGDAMLRILASKPWDCPAPFIWRDVVEVGPGYIKGPNGTKMIYHVEWSVERNGYIRRTRNGYRNIWGGGLVENLIQYLARLVMSQAMVRIRQRLGLRIVMTTHDELVMLLPDDGQAEQRLELCRKEMTRQLPWLPNTPLAAEGHLSKVYDK